VDLLKHCTYLDSELALTAPISQRNLSECNWEVRACKSDACPVRDRCPFLARAKRDPKLFSEEELLTLFQFAIVRRCVAMGQFLGRSIDSFFYSAALDELGVPSHDPIRSLLERLGRRGFVIGYRWTTGTEGIHGWLRPDEAAELSDRLFALNLPEYERSFVAMESFKSVQNILEGRGLGLEFNWPTYRHPDVSFEHLSLSFVRTVCFLATRQNKGVLWGNDIA
jgi:hypothetical protein